MISYFLLQSKKFAKMSTDDRWIITGLELLIEALSVEIFFLYLIA